MANGSNANPLTQTYYQPGQPFDESQLGSTPENPFLRPEARFNMVDPATGRLIPVTDYGGWDPTHSTYSFYRQRWLHEHGLGPAPTGTGLMETIQGQPITAPGALEASTGFSMGGPQARPWSPQEIFNDPTGGTGHLVPGPGGFYAPLPTGQAATTPDPRYLSTSGLPRATQQYPGSPPPPPVMPAASQQGAPSVGMYGTSAQTVPPQGNVSLPAPVVAGNSLQPSSGSPNWMEQLQRQNPSFWQMLMNWIGLRNSQQQQSGAPSDDAGVLVGAGGGPTYPIGNVPRVPQARPMTYSTS